MSARVIEIERVPENITAKGREKSAREIALKILNQVDQEGAYANLALNEGLARHRVGRLDSAFITELVYGTVRHLNTIDWALGQYTRRSLAALDGAVRNILRLGAYQLIYLDRVHAYAACNESANLARYAGYKSAVGFVNGVLRHLARGLPLVFPDPAVDPVQYLSLYYSYPGWLVGYWRDEYGPDMVGELLAAGNMPAPGTIRANTLKISAEHLLRRLKEEGFKAEKARYAPEGLYLGEGIPAHNPLFDQGLYFVQDEGSILVARALGVAAGATVLDLCSAPGGKTTHLAAMMGNRGEVVAVDIHPHRLRLLEENCRRLGVDCVRPYHADAQHLPELHARADYVLVDAPCSGLGVLRRRPDLRWRKSPENMADLTGLQARLLNEAALCVKPGGVMVYSTCTIRREENERQVERFLAAHPGFCADDLAPYLPQELAADEKSGGVQLFPHLHKTDGFYIARLKKNA